MTLAEPSLKILLHNRVEMLIDLIDVDDLLRLCVTCKDFKKIFDALDEKLFTEYAWMGTHFRPKNKKEALVYCFTLKCTYFLFKEIRTRKSYKISVFTVIKKEFTDLCFTKNPTCIKIDEENSALFCVNLVLENNHWYKKLEDFEIKSVIVHFDEMPNEDMIIFEFRDQDFFFDFNVQYAYRKYLIFRQETSCLLERRERKRKDIE